jgi:hypothetical protein
MYIYVGDTYDTVYKSRDIQLRGLSQSLRTRDTAGQGIHSVCLNPRTLQQSVPSGQ